jgi:hypothetical protein
VLMVLSLLVLRKRVDGQADSVLWLLSWCLIFLIPTFDVYPFSYRITLGAGLVYWLFLRFVRRPAAPGGAFAAVNARLGALAEADLPGPS